MRDRRVFLTILCLTILVSLTGGISIVMLVPMLGLLNVSEGAAAALRWLAAPLLSMPYEGQMIALVAEYFLLNVRKALLSQTLSIQENLFLEGYSYDMREELYRKVSGARWQELTASRQTDTIDLFTFQCFQVSNGVTQIIHLLSATVSSTTPSARTCSAFVRGQRKRRWAMR